MGLEGEPLVPGKFEARGVFVDPTITTFDTLEVAEVPLVGLRYRWAIAQR